MLTRVIDRFFGSLFRLFNRFFDSLSNSYVATIRRIVRGSTIVLILYAGFLALTFLGFKQVPGGFVPAQDKYYRPSTGPSNWGRWWTGCA
ncbi:efflux RND transporter permease subunit, partial [Pseudomonas aeruginosa]